MCRIVFVSLNKSNFIMMTMGQYFIIRQFVAMWCLKCLSISLDYSTNVGSQEWIHSTKSHKSVGKSEKDKCVLQRWHENLIHHKGKGAKKTHKKTNVCYNDDTKTSFITKGKVHKKHQKNKCVLQRWHGNLIRHKWQNITICSTFRNFMCVGIIIIYIKFKMNEGT